ncbi:hypothetical protein QE152_g40234 [Popillia japonica]|uniref:Uncharacterized protein n=1 Tax=Popillia japonica TaxID=7064 RepID=A0AAW1HRR8_POPJA
MLGGLLQEKQYQYYKIYRELKQEYLKKDTEMKQSSNTAFIHSSNNKTRAIWTIINNESKPSNSTTQRETLYLSPNDLNKYFCDVGEHIANDTQTTHSSEEFLSTVKLNGSSSFFFQPTTPEEIGSILVNMKGKHTTDIYDLSTYVLKQLITEISKPLSSIFNECVEQGVFPRLLKIVRVLPIFKKGNIA